jgi:predicted O-methyltransferase YrrM
MVETGVARGVTSRFLLLATREWDGHLWSVDLPPVYAGWRGEWGEAVEDALRDRWHLVRGSSRRLLKAVLRWAGAVDVAVLDSDHTTRTVRLECLAAWPALRAGGILLVDHVDRNRGFAQFVGAAGCRSWFVAHHALKEGLVGVARKEVR